MHGQIGDIRERSQARGDLDFYYRTRATLIEARRLGGGTIDYDFYRKRARRMRSRVHREFLQSLWPYARPFAAIAVIVAAIGMLPRHASDCPACDAPVGHHNSTTATR
jgi:hypothetical protein